MIHKCDSSLVVETANPHDLWCVFEHLVSTGEGAPPEVILVGACKLTQVYHLFDGKTNSEWATIFANGGRVLVHIIATGNDRLEIQRHAIAHARSFPTMPRCNLRGFNVSGSSRPITCDQNDTTYPSQKEAAEALGIQASAISRHMRGELKHVGGYTFRYKGIVS